MERVMVVDNGWEKYQQLVLSEIKDLKEQVAHVYRNLTDLKIDVAQLKVKAGVFGAVAGFLGAAVPIAVAIVVYLLK